MARRVAVVFLLALVVRVLFLQEIATTPTWRWQDRPQSQSAFLRAGVARMHQGDRVLRATPRPVSAPRSCPPGATWLAPGRYAQFAFFEALAGRSLYGMRILLAIVGAAVCALIAMLAAEAFGRTAGVAAGALAALYGPFVLADTLLLGDMTGLALALGGLLLAQRPGRALVAGVLLGIATQTYESTWIVLLAAIAWSFRGSRRDAGMIAAGALLGLAPFVARDLAAGAPPFPVSCAAIATLPDAGGRVSTIGAALLSRITDPLAIARDAFGALSEIEVPDEDFSFVFSQASSDMLFLLPRFSWVWLLAVAAAVRWIVARQAPARSAWLAMLPALAGVAIFAILGPVSGRTRLVLVPALLVPAGALLGEGWELLRRAEWQPLCRGAALVLVLRVLWFATPWDLDRWRNEVRLEDFVDGAAIGADQRGLAGMEVQFRQAWHYRLSRVSKEEAFEEGLRQLKAAMVFQMKLRRLDEVEEIWTELRTKLPDDARVQEAEQMLRAAGRIP